MVVAKCVPCLQTPHRAAPERAHRPLPLLAPLPPSNTPLRAPLQVPAVWKQPLLLPLDARLGGPGLRGERAHSAAVQAAAACATWTAASFSMSPSLKRILLHNIIQPSQKLYVAGRPCAWLSVSLAVAAAARRRRRRPWLHTHSIPTTHVPLLSLRRCTRTPTRTRRSRPSTARSNTCVLSLSRSLSLLRALLGHGWRARERKSARESGHFGMLLLSL